MHRTRGHQPVVERRAAHAAGGGVLPVGPVHGVEQAQRLGGAVAQVGAVALERVQPAHVDVGEVDRHAAVADPFRQHLAGAARALDADRVEAGGDEQVAQLGGLAQQVAVVGREALRAVEEGLDAGRRQDRQAARSPSPGSARNGPCPRAGCRSRSPPGCRPCPRAWPPARRRRPAACRHPPCSRCTRRCTRSTGRSRGTLGQRLGDDVEMLGRVQRHRHADGGRQLARPHAGGEHDGRRRATGPCSVITPTARPCSTRMRSTLTPSTIRAPRWRAPLAKACVVSIGLACPSLGRNTPPTASPTSSSG